MILLQLNHLVVVMVVNAENFMKPLAKHYVILEQILQCLLNPLPFQAHIWPASKIEFITKADGCCLKRKKQN